MWRGSPKSGGVWEQCRRVAWHDIRRRSKMKEEAGLPIPGERKQHKETNVLDVSSEEKGTSGK